jgi:hypothetical protein
MGSKTLRWINQWISAIESLGIIFLAACGVVIKKARHGINLYQATASIRE